MRMRTVLAQSNTSTVAVPVLAPILVILTLPVQISPGAVVPGVHGAWVFTDNEAVFDSGLTPPGPTVRSDTKYVPSGNSPNAGTGTLISLLTTAGLPRSIIIGDDVADLRI